MLYDRYRIVLIVPSGYKHSLCFAETGFLLKNSMASIGVDCDIAVNEPAADRINVILGYHLFPAGDFFSRYRYIPYQLEQLAVDRNGFGDKIKTILGRAASVWDYSPENIAFLAEHDIAAKHLPLGYHPALEMVDRAGKKDIDVLFFGSMADRRQDVLDRLRAGGATVQTLFGVYGRERDAYVARSRIVVNIHFYSAKIFEAVRVSYLLNNACCVVSEESEVYPYPGVDIPLVPYDRVAQTCLSLLGAKGGARETGERNYREFKAKIPMTVLIRNVLG